MLKEKEILKMTPFYHIYICKRTSLQNLLVVETKAREFEWCCMKLADWPIGVRVSVLGMTVTVVGTDDSVVGIEVFVIGTEVLVIGTEVIAIGTDVSVVGTEVPVVETDIVIEASI